MEVKLHNKQTIDSINWPDTENSSLARQYLSPIIKKGARHYFSNVSTDLQLLEVDGVFLPVTINYHVEVNAYVCSTYAHYICYGLDEVKHLKSAPLQKMARTMINLFGFFINKGNIDRTVFVNNWLLPTNLYPNLSNLQLQAITKTLIKKFPSHAIAFRSVSDLAPGGLKVSLQKLHYDLLLSRDIYYTNTQSQEPFKARMTKSDFKLLSGTEYTIMENDQIPENVNERLAHLYQMLNIEKYSAWNPHYTPALLHLLKSISCFHLKAWMKKQEAHAVLGYYKQDGVLTSPLFGYDTGLAQQQGLYRQISAALLKDAKEKGCCLHQSSGAGHYKQLRRAKKDLEYTAVYTRHLPKRRRLPWKMLMLGMNTIGKLFIEKRS